MIGAVRVALRTDDQEARGRSLGALADAGEQGLADDRFVRDHEHVRLAALGLEIDDDVLHRQATCGVADTVDHLPAQPARLLLRMGRDDDLGRLRVEHGDRVPDRIRGVGFDDETVRGDACLTQSRKRPVESAAGGGSSSVLVDDVALVGVADGSENGDQVGPALGPALERLDQARAGNRLVGYNKNVAQPTTPCSSGGSAVGPEALVLRPNRTRSV